MEYVGWIYRWTNNTNGKVYIGQTMNKKGYIERWSQHITNSRSFKGRNYFYNAIRKNGEDNFTKEVLHELKNKDKVELKKQLDILEIELIEKHDSTNSTKGYNSTKGGEFNIWNSLNEDDERYISLIEERKAKARDSEIFDILRKEVVLIDCDNNLIKKFKSMTDASDNLKISLSGAGIICRCGDNKGDKFVNHSGNTQSGNKLRYVDDWLDGLTEDEIRIKRSNFSIEDIEFEVCDIEDFTIETDIKGDIIDNSFLYISKDIDWFYRDGYKKLTKKQVGFIRGEILVPKSNQKRLLKTIQKRLGLTNN